MADNGKATPVNLSMYAEEQAVLDEVANRLRVNRSQAFRMIMADWQRMASLASAYQRGQVTERELAQELALAAVRLG